MDLSKLLLKEMHFTLQTETETEEKIVPSSFALEGVSFDFRHKYATQHLKSKDLVDVVCVSCMSENGKTLSMEDFNKDKVFTKFKLEKMDKAPFNENVKLLDLKLFFSDNQYNEIMMHITGGVLFDSIQKVVN